MLEGAPAEVGAELRFVSIARTCSLRLGRSDMAQREDGNGESNVQASALW